MANYVELRGREQVIQNYGHRNDGERSCPFFSVWCGKDLKFYFDGDDPEEGKALLDMNLAAVEANGITQIYTMVYHKDADSAARGNKTGVVGSVTFRLNDVTTGAPAQAFGNAAVMQKILDQQSEILSRLNAIEAEDEEEEDEEEKPNAFGFLNGIIQQPQVQQLIAAKVLGWLGMVPGEGSQPRAIAGIDPTLDDQQKLTQAITVLMQNGVTVDDLVKLADMATDNKQQLNFLLSMLRKQ